MTFASPEENNETPEHDADSNTTARSASQKTGKSSTLIEFPGANRSSKPQWRQQLSERVREIQERKARENDESPTSGGEGARVPVSGRQLGVVPPSEPADVNPIVAAALKRVERAQHTSTHVPRTLTARAGATAAARAAEEAYEVRPAPVAVPDPILVHVPVESPVIEVPEPEEIAAAEPVRERKLVMVTTQVSEAAVSRNTAVTISEEIEPKQEKPAPRKVIEGVIDDSYLSRLEAEMLPPVRQCDPLENYAPLGSRVIAATVDLLIVAFVSSPFAATIELSNGNWSDPRVLASMLGIVLLVMFLYHTSSFALSGRTFGMSLLSLRTVDSRTAAHPSTRQSLGRALLFIFVVATGFLGALAALFDGERRTLHDMLSRTVVVKD
jgi:uncharacterized RDD family membrane protein YckC